MAKRVNRTIVHKTNYRNRKIDQRGPFLKTRCGPDKSSKEEWNVIVLII